MFHLNILSYEHVLIPEAVNICPMLKVCVSNVGDVEDGVFSLKESVMKMWIFIVSFNAFLETNFRGFLMLLQAKLVAVVWDIAVWPQNILQTRIIIYENQFA